MLQVCIIFLLAEVTLVSSFTNSTVSCRSPDIMRTLSVTAGESLYLPCPNLACYKDTENTSYVWFKNLSRTMRLERIGTEEYERVHYHQSVLYIFQLNVEDTGCYITRWWLSEDLCQEFEIDIVVYEEFNTNLLYIPMSVVTVSGIPCPVCEHQQGNFIWYKNFSLIPSQESEQILRIPNASKENEGIYTCVCTWEHHGRKHNTSGSRQLLIEDHSATSPPNIFLPINNSIRITDMDTELVLTCSVYTGTNVMDEYYVEWERNWTALDEVDGYKMERREDNHVIHLLLTINKVSQVDFHSVFQCTVEDSYEIIFVSVTLKSKDDQVSRLTLVSACVCVVLLFLLVSGTIKCFAVDLVLLLRGIFIKLNRKEDGKMYDAYVIYEMNNLDDTTAITISEFVNRVLPTVLEKYYSYNLYIHGRDDLPGEDCMNLIETKIQLSRRLIFILTPGTGTEGHTVSPEMYDLQVGLHQALVQGDTGVILIQLEEMQEYTHLPLGLQHLLRKNPPLLWKHGIKTNSRFWKQVRYRMPVPSCQRRCVKKSLLDFRCPKIEAENGAELMHAIV